MASIIDVRDVSRSPFWIINSFLGLFFWLLRAKIMVQYCRYGSDVNKTVTVKTKTLTLRTKTKAEALTLKTKTKTLTLKTKTKAEAYATKTKKNTLVRVQHTIHEWQFTMQYTM